MAPVTVKYPSLIRDFSRHLKVKPPVETGGVALVLMRKKTFTSVQTHIIQMLHMLPAGPISFLVLHLRNGSL